MLRTASLFVVSAFFGVALACGGQSTTATASTEGGEAPKM